MLSTPPAFIPSQNQTLELIGIKPIFLTKTEALSSTKLSHYLCWLCFVVLFVLQSNWQKLLPQIHKNLRKIISFYSIFKLRYLRLSARCSRESFSILSQLPAFCQLFLRSFLRIFEVFLKHFCLKTLRDSCYFLQNPWGSSERLVLTHSFSKISHPT